MNRRQFLGRAGTTAGMMSLGAALWRVGSWVWPQSTARGYLALSATEVKVCEAVAEALFPGESGSGGLPSGVDVGVVASFDRSLSRADAVTRDFLRMVLRAVDELAVGVGGRLLRFHERSLEDRVAIINAWDNSMISGRRAAFRGIKFYLSMGYFESEVVVRTLGWRVGCGGRA